MAVVQPTPTPTPTPSNGDDPRFNQAQKALEKWIDEELAQGRKPSESALRARLEEEWERLGLEAPLPPPFPIEDDEAVLEQAKRQLLRDPKLRMYESAGEKELAKALARKKGMVRNQWKSLNCLVEDGKARGFRNDVVWAAFNAFIEEGRFDAACEMSSPSEFEAKLLPMIRPWIGRYLDQAAKDKAARRAIQKSR